MRTAAIVPSWTTAVKAAPGSGQPRKAGTMRRWAVLEIGRNSVSPCTIPSTMVSSALMVGSGFGCDRLACEPSPVTRLLRLDQLRRRLVALGDRQVGDQGEYAA